MPGEEGFETHDGKEDGLSDEGANDQVVSSEGGASRSQEAPGGRSEPPADAGRASVPARGLRQPVAILLGLASAGSLVPAGLRLALDHAGSTHAAAAVALMLLGCAAGAMLPVRSGGALPALLRFAVAILAAPILLLAARPIVGVAWPLLGGNPLGSFVLRLILLAAVLLLPSLAAGALLAVAVGGPGKDGESAGVGPASRMPAGFRPGIMAAAVSLGLALGGALILPILGLRGAAASGFGLCLTAVALAMRWGAPGAGTGVAGAASLDSAAGGPGAVAGSVVAVPAALAGLALGIAGVCWGRTIALIAGPTDASALSGAALILLGLAAGAILLPSSRTGRAPMAIMMLAVAGVLIDASAFLVPAFSAWCAGLVAGGGAAAGMLPILASIVLVLPASLAFGGALACLAGLAGDAGQDAAGPAGVLAPLAAGTATGVILGAVLLVPTMGLRRGLALASATALFALLPALGGIPFRKPALKGSASLGVLVAMLVVGGFPAPWDPRVTAGGLYRYGVGASARFDDPGGWLASRLRGAPPEFYREGRHATVTVERTVQRISPVVEAESLLIDGRAVGNTGIDARSQILTGEIPMLLHGPAQTALVIDFSLGLTAGSVLRHPVRSLTVIEREEAVTEAAPIFGGLANNPAGDSRLRLVHDDPKGRLRVEAARYDVIVVTGTDPWLPHMAGLITDEGYALLRSRLAEKGIVAQRLSLGAAADPVITAWMRAFVSAFPSVLLFQTSPDDLLLVGSESELRLDPEAVQKMVGEHAAIADDLSRATVIGSDEMLLTLRLGTEALRKMLGEGPSNPEDRRGVTVQAARDLSVQRQSRLPERIDGAWEGFAALLAPAADGPAREARAALLYRLAKSYLGLAGDPQRAMSLAKDLEGLGATTRARWVTGEALLQQRDVDGALKEWEAVLAMEPDNLDALFSLGMFQFDARDYFDAERYLARAAKAHADTAVVLYNHGRALFQIGRYEPAIEALHQARVVAAGRETYPLVDYFVGLSAARLKRDREAETALRDYLKWAYAQDTLTRVEVDAHLKLAEVLERKGSRLEGFEERQKATRLQERIQAYAQSRGAGANAGRPDVPPPQEPAADTIVPEPPAGSPATPPLPSDGR
jgi:spermidine synthase